MEGLHVRHGGSGLVLNRAIVLSTFTTCMSLLGTAGHAYDGLPVGGDSVQASVACQSSLASSCVGSLAVTRDAEDAALGRSANGRSTSTPICHYEQDFIYTPASAVRAKHAPDRIEVMHRVCPGGSQNLGAPWAFMPSTRQPASPGIRALVDQATKAVNISTPQPSLSPAATTTQIVGLPLWAWTSASEWNPKSVTVEAAGASLTMTATPAFSVWSMGDGGSVVCRGPGTPYPSAPAASPPEKSPDCGYTYVEPSTSQPGETYRVSVTTHWKLVWTATNGSSGAEPDLTATSNLRLKVSEVQALITRVRS
jgi:hypothetical protein